VASVVEVVVGLAVVVGAGLAASASSLLPGRRHWDEHVPTTGPRAQHQAGWEGAGGEAREDRWWGG
jgi:hypothetical protein